MSDLDRIETNFRLSLISQRDQTATMKEVPASFRDFGREVMERFELLAQKVDDVAQKGEETAARLEDSISVLGAFAEGQVEIRQTLAADFKENMTIQFDEFLSRWNYEAIPLSIKSGSYS